MNVVASLINILNNNNRKILIRNIHLFVQRKLKDVFYKYIEQIILIFSFFHTQLKYTVLSELTYL